MAVAPDASWLLVSDKGSVPYEISFARRGTVIKGRSRSCPAMNVRIRTLQLPRIANHSNLDGLTQSGFSHL